MPTNPKLKVENLFDAALTAPVASATGDVTLSLTVAPANPFGGLVIDPDDSGKRETVIYHAKSGLDVSVYGVNRTNGNTHLSGAAVKMLNLAELFNLMSGMVSWTFFTFQRSALDVTVNGGPVAPGLTASDTDITVGNGTTYLWFNPSDSSVNSTQNASVVTAANGITFATVVAGGGSISSITYERFVTGSFLFSSMRDVSVSGATDGQMLEYDSANDKWIPGTKYFALGSLTDVDAATPTDGYALKWDAVANKWKPAPIESSGAAAAPTGSVTTDEGTFWKTTYADGSYVEYKADGIYNYDTDANLVSYDAKTGTYSASGMSYTDGIDVNDDGEISGDASVAYRNQPNVFTQTNQFESGTLFKKAVYGQLVTTTASVDFSLGNTQKIAISGATALAFSNLSPGTNFGLFVVNSGGGSISGITATDVAGGAMQVHCPNGTIPDVTAAGGYLLGIYVAETAAHVFANPDPTSSI
jgi:hypothetical protein